MRGCYRCRNVGIVVLDDDAKQLCQASVNVRCRGKQYVSAIRAGVSTSVGGEPAGETLEAKFVSASA